MTRFNTVRGLCTAVLFMCLTATLGCGGSGKCSVSGKVTHNGKPVYGGMITLIGGKDEVAQGAIELDGTFTIRDAPTGKVKVGIVSQKPPPPRPDRGGGRAAPGGTPEPVADPTKWFAIPEKYGDPNSSGKEMTLKGGSNTQDITLE